MKSCDIGVIGLAVMGQNLVMNMAGHGFKVAAYNRRRERTDELVNGPAKTSENVKACYDLEDFVACIRSPRVIMLMIQAGAAVDAVIEQLLPLIDKGDIIIDGGNSYFPDTRRRCAYLEEKGYLFMGVGISGGEEGALNGPSIMPGGSREAWHRVEPILKAISAKVDGGTPCCEYVGTDGAGHYVKMTHNGIEYGDMQLIAESYFLLKELGGLDAAQTADVFAKWNKGPLDSYLIEITADIFTKTDPETGAPLVELILDRAGQKGTGKWTSQESLELGVAAPTVAEAVYARCMSADKAGRVAASKILSGPDKRFDGDVAQLIDDIEQALYASKICSYAQGFALLAEASRVYGWALDLGNISLLWRGGCIIRAQFLERIKEAYDRKSGLENLMLDPYFTRALQDAQGAWRRVAALCTDYGVPAPCFASALAYFDAYRRERLPANLIQAQRDYFGAHTYERTDKKGAFHTQWF